jgi:hypothetical protein
MALALKEELHRLVDEIPESRPEVARVLFELGLLLTFASGNDSLMFRRFTREVAEAQAQASNADELLTRLQSVRNRWVHGQEHDDDALLRFLESAPDDDEPLTPEEAAMLDARLAGLASGNERTFSHEEVGRMLGEVDRTLKE